MAGPSEPFRPKSASDLTRWLEREVSPRLREVTEAVAHGGTALTLLGIKDSTKDVDFAFRSREAFDGFANALESMGFRRTADFRANPGEAFHRLENPGSIIDVVDLRFPLWNNWRLTKAVLRRAVIIPLANVRLVRPDRDAVFLFKTYPLRPADIDDLRTILAKARPDQSRVIELFDEQDAVHRADLLGDTRHEPLFNILELRVRFAGSLRLLGPSRQREIPRIARHARARFLELRLRQNLAELVRILRDKELVSWEDIIGADFDALRDRLAKGRPRQPGRQPPPGGGRARTRGRSRRGAESE